MVTVNKPNHEMHRSSSDDSKTSSSLNVASTDSNGASSSTHHPDQRIDSSVDRLHRAWRQMVSSFLVAARSHPTMPNPTREQIQDQEKIMSDTLETTLRSRSELRRMLSLIEENLTGSDGKRRELLEDDLYSLPTAISTTFNNNNKRRKQELATTGDVTDKNQEAFDSFFAL